VSSTSAIAGVHFVVDGHRVAATRRDGGLWTAAPLAVKPGKHVLAAVENGRTGGSTSARRIVRTCRK
jgi:hypothetical protein